MVLATPASGCSFFETKCARSFYFCFNVIAKCEIGSELGPFLLKSAFFLVIFNKGKKKRMRTCIFLLPNFQRISDAFLFILTENASD